MPQRKSSQTASAGKMQVLKVDPDMPDKKVILEAARIIKSGGLVAFPTETVYGIAASFEDKKAIEALYRVKKRPSNKPFTVHISDIGMIGAMDCEITADAKKLIDRFWPGPLTIIIKSRAGHKTGFRMPANRVALELIAVSGVPIVAPSANLSGNKPPTSAAEVQRELEGRIDAVIDGGQTEVGIESTVVDLTVSPPKVLREGAITAEDILKVING